MSTSRGTVEPSEQRGVVRTGKPIVKGVALESVVGARDGQGTAESDIAFGTEVGGLPVEPDAEVG